MIPAALQPGGARWESLSLFEKFEVVEDTLSEIRRPKAGPRYRSLIADYTSLYGHLRKLCTLADPLWDMTHNHYLRTTEEEGSRVVLFRPRPAQEKLLKRYMASVDQKRPFRLLNPKMRRGGSSETWEKVGYNLVFRNEGFQGLVICQSADDQIQQRQKYTTGHENDPLQPALSADNESFMEMERGGSSLLFMSAGTQLGRTNRGKRRGQEFHFIHGTEVAFWPLQAVKLLVGLLSAMPRWPIWKTAAILESTGNGREGLFFDLSEEVLDNAVDVEEDISGSFFARSSVSDWCLQFLSFLDLHDCFLPLEPGEKETLEAEVMGSHGDEEERLLVEYHGALWETIKWRRWAIQNTTGPGSFDDKLAEFHVEYPFKVDQVFRALGKSVFNLERVQQRMAKCAPSSFVGRLTVGSKLWRSKDVDIVPMTPMPGLKKDPDKGSPLRIWTHPERGHRYMLAVDPSEGLIYGDNSVIHVEDRDTDRQVAEFVCKYDQEDLIDPVRLMSVFYNDARIVVEVNKGRLLIKWLKQTDRRRYLYKEKDSSFVASSTKTAHEERYGIDMNEQVKRVGAGYLKQTLDNNPAYFVSQELLKEMLNFEQTLSANLLRVLIKGAPAGANKKDDRVMAAMLARIGNIHLPLIGTRPYIQDEEQRVETIGDRWDIKFRKKATPKPVHPDLGEVF